MIKNGSVNFEISEKMINEGENASDVKIISTEVMNSSKRLINFVDKFKI